MRGSGQFTHNLARGRDHASSGYFNTGSRLRVAQSVAALSRRWWHNSLFAVHHMLMIAYFERLGVPRLS